MYDKILLLWSDEIKHFNFYFHVIKIISYSLIHIIHWNIHSSLCQNLTHINFEIKLEHPVCSFSDILFIEKFKYLMNIFKNYWFIYLNTIFLNQYSIFFFQLSVSVFLSLYLFIYLFISLSVWLTLCLSFCLSLSLSLI